ncbi:MAG TPA: peptide-methionine (S)-S-oxide reductase MsrA [Bryobacteraceae bacterium]|nr:peptide-methionine (S)-S-oxide reductase MsrA [Bryobacteraceae bacterium]
MADLEVVTLGGGCFWCLEAVYREAIGVVSAVSGYMGGKSSDPSYKEVCSGRSGHVEVVQLTFNPAEISFREVLEIFFVIHDSTTLNRQGNDVGTQYRSVIFYHSPEQKVTAESMIEPQMVTAVEAAETFWTAEGYHQDYLTNNPYQPYCMFVVDPKVQKFRKTFAAKRKPS